MEILLTIQTILIIFLLYKLLSREEKEKRVSGILRYGDYGKDAVKITYSWKLDSARKTQLKGHLPLKFDKKEIEEQRMSNPFAIPNNNGTESNLRKMYFHMLSNPWMLLHCAEIVKYINRECSKNNVGELDKLQFVLDFVQEPNVKYSYDEDCPEIQHPKEYIRFPDETLYDRHGDCDCKSFLAVTLFHLMGYNVLYLLSYKLGHAAICVEYDQRWKAFLQNKKEVEDVTIEYNGSKYVYCETTSDHYRIGGISPDYTVNDFETKIEIKG